MIRECHAALAVKYYYTVTHDVSELLGTYFSVAFPEEHARYREAFDAGVWHLEDPGPWLGRALVYKLQVKPHRDALDGGPTAMFNVGQYEGGRLYYPCLDLKFLSASPLLWSTPVTDALQIQTRSYSYFLFWKHLSRWWLLDSPSRRWL